MKWIGEDRGCTRRAHTRWSCHTTRAMYADLDLNAKKKENGREQKKKEQNGKIKREIKHGVRHVNYTIFTIGFI